MGTPEYMSPEQGQGTRVDGRSDIYSLGIMLYQMLTGRVPFSASTPMATLYQVINHAPLSPRQVDPNIPTYLEGIILKAIAERPEDRFQSGQRDGRGPAKAPQHRPPRPTTLLGLQSGCPHHQRQVGLRKPLVIVGAGLLVSSSLRVSVGLSGLFRNGPPGTENATKGLPAIDHTY